MSDKEIKKERKETQREAVVLFINNEKGEILFTKRSKNRKFLPGVWALPSGHIKIGESVEETARREAEEELNIQIHTVTLNEIIHEPSGDNTKIHLLGISATSYTGIPIINTDEFDEIAWIEIASFYDRFSDAEIGSTLRYLRPKLQGKNTLRG